MGSEAREARRRKIEAEKVSIHVAMDMISEVERASLYNVQSFSNSDGTYEVRLSRLSTSKQGSQASSFWDVVLNMMFGEMRNVNAREKENSSAFNLKAQLIRKYKLLKGCSLNLNLNCKENKKTWCKS
ncbi:hypothetical protein AB4K20DRAFT_1926150 [Rhizopus microsporus]